MRILREMELAGLKLDTERLRGDLDRVKAEADALEREIFELAGEEFMLGSPKQLEEILFGKLGLSRKRRGKTGYSTDARVLQAIRARAPGDPEDRALARADEARPDLPRRAAAADRAPTGGCTRPSTRRPPPPGGCRRTTPTSRTSRSGPPLGREIRACFVAEPGNLLVSADYSQVELRLLAHIAGEDVLKEIFRRGEDVHTATACRVFGVTPDQIDPGMRSKAKMINYGIVYGLSAYGMADRLDIPQAEADEFIQRYLAGFPAVGAVHRGDDRAGDRARLRLDAVRPPPPGPRAARAPLGAAQAGRAVRGQHGDPGHRRRHHEGRDGPLRRARSREAGLRRG